MAEKTHSNRWVTSGLECLDVILGQVEPGGMGEVLGVERAGWRSTLERPEADTGRQSGDEIDSTKTRISLVRLAIIVPRTRFRLEMGQKYP